MLGSSMLVTAGTLRPRIGLARERSTISTGSRQLAERFNRAAELARSRGMRVGYHNHFWEFGTDFDGRSGLDVFYELCEPDVVAEIDIYWAQVGGRDPVDLVRTLGDRVACST